MKRKGLLAFIVVGAVSAAALAAPASPTSAQTSRHAACFWTRNIDSFASIDNETVYVRVNLRDVYELKLFAPCLDVDWAHHVGLRTRGSSNVCEGRGHNLEIYVRTTANRQRCPVSSIRRLTPAEVGALPSAARP